MERMVSQHPADPQHGGHRRHGHGGARLVSYYLATILVNILLGFYALFAIGKCMEHNWGSLAGGTTQSIVETVLQLLLLLSPILLTIFLNRILFHSFRRRHRFPRGAGFLAFIIVLLVQAVTIYLVYNFGLIPSASGFTIDTVTQIVP